jgi:large conductance mechanosensitive channel
VGLAIAVIIGLAANTLVKSLVDNIIMPLVGMLSGGVNFDTLAIKVGAAELKYGLAISAIVKFVAVALFLFMVIKAANRMKKKQAYAQDAPAPPSSTDALLIEIRDALKR